MPTLPLRHKKAAAHERTFAFLVVYLFEICKGNSKISFWYRDYRNELRLAYTEGNSQIYSVDADGHDEVALLPVSVDGILDMAVVTQWATDRLSKGLPRHRRGRALAARIVGRWRRPLCLAISI